ncbi:MAG: hypothetical protein RR100_09920 [Comamonas sp.]
MTHSSPQPPMGDSDSTDDIMAQAQVMIARLRALLQASDEVRRQHGHPAQGAPSQPPDTDTPAGPSTKEP